MNVHFVYKVLTNRIRALIIAAGYIKSLNGHQTPSFPHERVGSGHETMPSPTRHLTVVVCHLVQCIIPHILRYISSLTFPIPFFPQLSLALQEIISRTLPVLQ